MKIKLDNMDRDDFTVLVTASWLEASEDQTIEGSRWEHAGDDFAYTILSDDPGLLERLTKDGYEIDDGEYSSPSENDVAKGA